MSIFLMSVLLGMAVEFHHPNKISKKILGVMRSRRRFGMILHGEDGEPLVSHPLRSTIVEIDLGQFDLLWIERLRVDTEAMVLGGDHHPTRSQIFDGLVRTSMTKLEFERPAPEG